MTARLFFLFTALCTTFAFGQSSKLFDAYKIPTFSYYTLQVSGQDFLSYNVDKYDDSNQDFERLAIQAGLFGQYVRQSPMYSGFADADIDYYYRIDKTKRVDYSSSVYGKIIEVKDERAQADLTVRSFNDFYLIDEKGGFAFGNFTGRYNYYNPGKTGISFIELSAGAGYGRIVGLRSVVQAYILGKELEANLSDEDIQKLSEIIEKKDNGYYRKFRDDSEIEFYKDITAVTKKTEYITKAQQVFNSAIYKTAERMNGWRIRAGINYFDVGGDNYLYTNVDNLTDFQVKAEYAVPVGFNMQVYFSGAYAHNLEKGIYRTPKANFSCRFSIDHSYTWSSTINFACLSVFPEKEDEKINLKASLTSSLVVLNSLSLYGTLSYEKYKFYDNTIWMQNFWLNPSFSPSDKTEKTEIHFGLRYYIL